MEVAGHRVAVGSNILAKVTGLTPGGIVARDGVGGTSRWGAGIGGSWGWRKEAVKGVGKGADITWGNVQP
jgi:hypothetical protein|tara:strand:+ start:353 stop:562 length:210 start_codon:yes stop_codon:yes gene_type:complete